MTIAILLLGIFLVAGAIVAMCVALGLIGQSVSAVRKRLLSSVSAAEVVTPTIRFQRSVSGLTRFITTGSGLAKINRNVILAGQPKGLGVARILMFKLIGTGVGVLLLLMLVSKDSTLVTWLLGGVAVFVGYVGPAVIVQRRAEARQLLIQDELPDVLDQVTISIESGLGFEAAFAHIGARRTGPLADEIVRTMQDMRLGVSRRDAYQALADRNDVEDLRRFVQSIVQAEKYGVSIASVVRTQAVEIRFRRRKRAEAQALKVPVKIVFPLMVCIMPVLFIVILTPAGIRIVDLIGQSR